MGRFNLFPNYKRINILLPTFILFTFAPDSSLQTCNWKILKYLNNSPFKDVKIRSFIVSYLMLHPGDNWSNVIKIPYLDLGHLQSIHDTILVYPSQLDLHIVSAWWHWSRSSSHKKLRRPDQINTWSSSTGQGMDKENFIRKWSYTLRAFYTQLSR